MLAILSFWQSVKLIQRIIRFAFLPLYIFFWFILKIKGIEPFNAFDNLSLSISTVIIVLFSFLSYFYFIDQITLDKFNDKCDLKAIAYPYLWIVLGIIGYHFGNLTVFILIKPTSAGLWLLHPIFNLVKNMFFIYAFYLLSKDSIKWRLT